MKFACSLKQSVAMLVLLVVNLVNIVNRKTGNRENRLVTVPFRAARVSN